MKAKEYSKNPTLENARRVFTDGDDEEKKLLHFIITNKLIEKTNRFSKAEDTTMRELQKDWKESVMRVSGKEIRFTPSEKVVCVECGSPAEFHRIIAELRDENKLPLPNLMYLDFMIPDSCDTIYHIYLEEDDRTKEADELTVLAAKHFIDLGYPALVLCTKEYAAKHFPEAVFLAR